MMDVPFANVSSTVISGCISVGLSLIHIWTAVCICFARGTLVVE